MLLCTYKVIGGPCYEKRNRIRLSRMLKMMLGKYAALLGYKTFIFNF